MAKKRESVVTPEGRLVFPNLFTPTAFEEGKKETYNCLLVFPKGTDLSALNAAVKRALLEKFPKGAPGARNPVRDGNEKADDWGDLFRDALYIRASSLYQPRVVDRAKQEIIDEKAVYGGCYARLVVSPYGYDTMGNKGVSIGLDAVQILRDGEPLGGGSAAVKLFDDLDGAAGGDLDDPFGN